jgi:hypothetical protein
MNVWDVKSWFFTRNTPKISHLPPQLEKIWFFGVKSWFFTRNNPKFFAPPSTRRNFLLSAPPLAWNPWFAPAKGYYLFFPIAEGGAKIFGVFRVKNHDFTSKNHLFSNFRGGSAPALYHAFSSFLLSTAVQYEVIYVIKTVMKYHLKKIDTSFH